MTSPSTFQSDHARCRKIRAYGLDRIMQHSHEVTWRDEGDSFTQRLRAAPQKGGDAMRETVASMTQMQASSRRVGEIVSVIDGIAFQTNILALNAAVEAATAAEPAVAAMEEPAATDAGPPSVAAAAGTWRPG